MKNLKIIQIILASSSYSVKDYDNDAFRVWGAKTAFELKKIIPKTEVECWIIEKKHKKEKTIIKNDIKFRIFPTNLSIRHGMEISLPIIRAIIKEQKKAQKESYRLIIHLHEYHTWQSYAILLLIKKRNIKIIAQHHGGRSPLENLRKYKRLFIILPLILLMQLFENLLFRKIDMFYALSDNEIQYLKKIALNSEIKFQTMGISEEYFEKIDKRTARKRLNLELDKKYILYIGRIKTTKGLKELLDAMKNLENKNVELLLIGEGPDFYKYKEYAQKNNINNIKFLGPIYSKEKLDYLSACDCLILPSHTEGAPVVLMESIAKNLPVIATGVGGVNKMTQNGREGIIIKSKSSEEIVKAINEILTWKKKNIKKYAEKYKWEKIIKETIKEYVK